MSVYYGYIVTDLIAKTCRHHESCQEIFCQELFTVWNEAFKETQVYIIAFARQLYNLTTKWITLAI